MKRMKEKWKDWLGHRERVLSATPLVALGRMARSLGLYYVELLVNPFHSVGRCGGRRSLRSLRQLWSAGKPYSAVDP